MMKGTNFCGVTSGLFQIPIKEAMAITAII